MCELSDEVVGGMREATTKRSEALPCSLLASARGSQSEMMKCSDLNLNQTFQRRTRSSSDRYYQPVWEYVWEDYGSGSTRGENGTDSWRRAGAGAPGGFGRGGGATFRGSIRLRLTRPLFSRVCPRVGPTTAGEVGRSSKGRRIGGRRRQDAAAGIGAIKEMRESLWPDLHHRSHRSRTAPAHCWSH
jgi:hypothetical protein